MQNVNDATRLWVHAAVLIAVLMLTLSPTATHATGLEGFEAYGDNQVIGNSFTNLVSAGGRTT